MGFPFILNYSYMYYVDNVKYKKYYRNPVDFNLSGKTLISYTLYLLYNLCKEESVEVYGN